jgi:hypothetical protein
MTEFDLRSPTTRILECAKCDQLVAGEPAGLRVELSCGYCGFDDVRELAGATPAEEGASAYRGKKRDGRGRVIQADLSVPPKGHKQTGKLDVERAAWLEAKRALAAEVSDDERFDREYRALFHAAATANGYVAKLEMVRARAVLETLLELLVTPAYRAIALARLARVAALSDAADLADKWLDAAPRGLRIPEVTSEIRVAEALAARARGDAKEVLRATGQRDTVDEFLGPTRALAVALRTDAHEAIGEHGIAFKVYREALGKKIGVANIAIAYRLAPKTRTKAMFWGFAIFGCLFVLVGTLATMIARMADHAEIGTTPVALFGVAFVALVILAKK